MKIFLRSHIVILNILLLCSCGQTGKLYLPSKPTATAVLTNPITPSTSTTATPTTTPTEQNTPPVFTATGNTANATVHTVR